MSLNEHVLVATNKSLKSISLSTGIEAATSTEEAHNESTTVFLFGKGSHTDRGFLATCDSFKPLMRFHRLDKFNTSCKRVTLPEKAAAADSSVDGVLIAVGCVSGNLYIWDSTTGAFIRFLSLAHRISQLKFTSNYLVVCCKTAVFVYPLSVLVAIDDSVHEHVEPLVTFAEHRSEIRCIGVVETALLQGWLVTGDQDGSLYVWDIQNGEILLHVTSNSTPVCLAINPLMDNQLLVGYDNGAIKRVDLAACVTRYKSQNYMVPMAETQIETLSTVPNITRMEFSAYGDCLLAGTPQHILSLDIQTRQIVRTIRFDDPIVWFSSSLVAMRTAEELAKDVKSSGAGNLEILPSFKLLETVRMSPKDLHAAVYVPRQNLSDLLDEQATDEMQSDVDAVFETWYQAFVGYVQFQRQRNEDQEQIHTLKGNMEVTTDFIRRLLQGVLLRKGQSNEKASAKPDQFDNHTRRLLWRIAKAVTPTEDDSSSDHVNCLAKGTHDLLTLKLRPHGVYSESLPGWSRTRANAQDTRYPVCVQYVSTSAPFETVEHESRTRDSEDLGTQMTSDEAVAASSEGPIIENITTTESLGPSMSRKRPRLVPIELVSDEAVLRRVKRRRKILQTFNLKKGIERIMSALHLAPEEDAAVGLPPEGPDTTSINSLSSSKNTEEGEALAVDSGSPQQSHGRNGNGERTTNSGTLSLPMQADTDDAAQVITRKPEQATLDVEGVLVTDKSTMTDEEKEELSSSASSSPVLSAASSSAASLSQPSSQVSDGSQLSEDTKQFFIELAASTKSDGRNEEENLLHQKIQAMVLQTQERFDLPFKQLPRIYPLKSIVRKRKVYNLTHKHPISTAELGWYLHNESSIHL